MTNAALDIQPALCPFHVLVRAGRLIKFKGQMASIAPGLYVVAMAAVMCTGGVDQAVAQVATDCGTPTDGVVVCAADADVSTPDFIDPYSDGITYTGDGLTLILDDPSITVGGSGVKVRVPWGSEGDISVQMKNGVNITTTGSGLVADNTSGDATALMNEGSITTTGSGIVAAAIGVNGSATALMIEGNVDTSGDGSSGLVAGSDKRGDALARMDGGKITTVGRRSAHGLWAWVTNADSDDTATARMTGGTSVRAVPVPMGLWRTT